MTLFLVTINLYNDGSLEFIFTLYDLQKEMGKNSLNANYWLLEKLDELQYAQLKVRPENGIFEEITFSVLNDHAVFREKVGKTGKPYHSVTFNKYYLQMFEVDINAYTGVLTKKIIGLNSAGAQALVRYCLSHKNVNIRFSKLLKNIGLTSSLIPKETVSRVKKKVLEMQDQLSEYFGINFNCNTEGYSDKDPLVTYKQHDKVWFKDPNKS